MTVKKAKRSDTARLRHLVVSYWRGLFNVYRPERHYMRGTQRLSVSAGKRSDAQAKRD